MAEWTKQDVRNTAPEFASLDDAALDAFIERAAQVVNPAAFGERVTWAGSLMTAHLLTLFPPAGVNVQPSAPGPVVSRTVGPVSVTYAVPPAPMIGLTYAETKYGRLYAQLARLSVPGPVVL